MGATTLYICIRCVLHTSMYLHVNLPVYRAWLGLACNTSQKSIVGRGVELLTSGGCRQGHGVSIIAEQARNARPGMVFRDDCVYNEGSPHIEQMAVWESRSRRDLSTDAPLGACAPLRCRQNRPENSSERCVVLRLTC